MKYEFLSKWEKNKRKQDQIEEDMIRAALYDSNETVLFKGRRFVLKYVEVRNGELTYFAENDNMAVWLPERLIAS